VRRWQAGGGAAELARPSRALLPSRRAARMDERHTVPRPPLLPLPAERRNSADEPGPARLIGCNSLFGSLRVDNAPEQRGLGQDGARPLRPSGLDSGAGRGGGRGQGDGSRRHGHRGSTERFCDEGGAAAANYRRCSLPSAHGCGAVTGDELRHDALDEHDADRATGGSVATAERLRRRPDRQPEWPAAATACGDRGRCLARRGSLLRGVVGLGPDVAAGRAKGEDV
jgi:hypothetical protein